MRLSDVIAEAIVELLNRDGGEVEIKRNDFANRIGCVPSQINYVLTSRFTPEQGYLVESRRGGGGYIKITRVVNSSKTALIMHTVNSLGDRIDGHSVRVTVANLCYSGSIDEKMGILIVAATSDNALRDIEIRSRDIVRATVFKQLLIAASGI